MATVYSSNYSTGTYTYTRVKVDYSGTSATATLLYSRTNSWSGQTGQIGTFTFGGVSTSYDKYFTGEQTDAVVASVNFTISTSGGTYSGTSTSSGSDHFLDFSGSVTIPAQATPPTGLSATNVTRLVEGFSATVSVTGWGGAGDATTRYRELQCWTYDPNDFVQPRRYQPVYGNALSGNITVDNSSSYTSAYGPLTIVGNTKYVLGVYASNGSSATNQQRVGEYTTLAYPPEISISSISGTSATLAYSVRADGGEYTKTYEYSIDGGTTWTTFATVSSGSATTGTFTVSGLTAATVTVMQTRVTTTAGTTVGPNITLNTNAGPKLYGSVNSQANGVTTLYGSSNSQATAINKLYGSAGGQTKLIYQGFGHAPIYGRVEFYTDNTYTTTKTVPLESQADVNKLKRMSSLSWSVTIGGETITNENVKSVILGELVTSLPNTFLSDTTHLATLDIQNTRITTIGYSFLLLSSSFNAPIIFPDTVTTIGSGFLWKASAFNQDLTLPPNLTSIDSAFLREANQMVGVVNVGNLPATIISPDRAFATTLDTAPMYTTGITIAGPNRAAWLNALPDSTAVPYRKLIDAGY